MEEIDLKDLFMYFLKKIPVILIISIIITTLGMTYVLALKTPLYQGNVTLVLVKKEKESNPNDTVTQNDIILNQKLVATYSEIIKSRRVLKQVISNLGLECTASELSNRISVSSVSDTEIIKISVHDSKSNMAAKIANTIADVFKKEIVKIYNLENISIIDKAEEQKEPYNIQIAKSLILYFAIGFILSIAILFVIYYFDTSIKSSEEIEEKLGVPVIGSLPLLGKKEK